MFTQALPNWLKSSPAFRNAIAEARGDAEADRAALAHALARIQSDTDARLPQLERALTEAKSAQDAAWRKHQAAVRAVQVADGAITTIRSHTDSQRRLTEARLVELADPTIAPALVAIDDALESHRHTQPNDPVTAAHQHTALVGARRELAALLTAVGVDAPRVIADVLARVGLTVDG